MKRPAVVLATLFVAGNVYTQGDHTKTQPGKADSRGQRAESGAHHDARMGVTTYGVEEAGQPGKAENRGQKVRLPGQQQPHARGSMEMDRSGQVGKPGKADSRSQYWREDRPSGAAGSYQYESESDSSGAPASGTIDYESDEYTNDSGFDIDASVTSDSQSNLAPVLTDEPSENFETDFSTRTDVDVDAEASGGPGASVSGSLDSEATINNDASVSGAVDPDANADMPERDDEEAARQRSLGIQDDHDYSSDDLTNQSDREIDQSSPVDEPLSQNFESSGAPATSESESFRSTIDDDSSDQPVTETETYSDNDPNFSGSIEADSSASDRSSAEPWDPEAYERSFGLGETGNPSLDISTEERSSAELEALDTESAVGGPADSESGRGSSESSTIDDNNEAIGRGAPAVSSSESKSSSVFCDEHCPPECDAAKGSAAESESGALSSDDDDDGEDDDDDAGLDDADDDGPGLDDADDDSENRPL